MLAAWAVLQSSRAAAGAQSRRIGCETSEGVISVPFSASQARLEHCPVSSLALTLTERCRQTREENSNHDCKRLRNVSCVEGWNSFFELEKKTQCKDSSTVFKCINTFVKMTVNTCPVTANDGTKSNLLKCN